MNKLARLPLITALVALALAPACAKSVLLKHKFTSGQIDNYKLSVNLRMSMPGMPGAPSGPMAVGVTAMMRQKVLGVRPDGSAKILITCSGAKVSAPGMADQTSRQIPAQSMVVTMAPDGSLVSYEGQAAAFAGMDMNRMTGLMGYYGIFPNVPVEPGQSWTLTMPLAFNSGSMSIDSVLLAAALPVGRDSAAKIKQTYSASLDLTTLFKAIAGSASVPFDLSKLNGGAQMGGWSVTYFSPTRGKLLRANGNLQAVLTMDMPAQAVAQGAPSQLNIQMVLEMNMTRV